MRTASRPHLFLTDRGTGEPVLLITGWTISSAVFDPVAELYLPHLRAIAYDHRGAGRSGAWHAPVSMAMLAADAARVLDDRGLRNAHIVGLSMGAGVALELAVRMPHRVKSLVLVGGGAGGPATVRPGVRSGFQTLGGVLADSVPRGQLWPSAALFSDRFRQEHPNEVATYMPFFARHRAPPWTSAWQLLAVGCFGRRSALRRVRAPTLVLHGELDAMAPVGNAQLLAGEIPGAELYVVERAGHAVPLERPRECAGLLVDWVGRHAHVEPGAPRRVDVIAERVTRPAALHTGTLRNTRDATTTAVGGLARRFGIDDAGRGTTAAARPD